LTDTGLESLRACRRSGTAPEAIEFLSPASVEQASCPAVLPPFPGGRYFQYRGAPVNRRDPVCSLAVGVVGMTCLDQILSAIMAKTGMSAATKIMTPHTDVQIVRIIEFLPTCQK